MFSNVFTNKWFLGGIGFLIVLSVACVLWYRHDIADERKAAADAKQLLRQSEIAKKVSDTGSEVEQAADAPAESSTLTVDKPITETHVTENRQPMQAQNETESPTETAEIAEVRVSPHGFGPYPEVPKDYPTTVSWERDQTYLPEALHSQSELLSRVLVKLWTNGDKNFHGGSTHKGRVYPHYHNTVYVRFANYMGSDRKMVRYPTRIKSGPQVVYTEADLLDPPPHLRILDLDSSGIDPYQFLDLP